MAQPHPPPPAPFLQPLNALFSVWICQTDSAVRLIRLYSVCLPMYIKKVMTQVCTVRQNLQNAHLLPPLVGYKEKVKSLYAPLAAPFPELFHCIYSLVSFLYRLCFGSRDTLKKDDTEQQLEGHGFLPNSCKTTLDLLQGYSSSLCRCRLWSWPLWILSKSGCRTRLTHTAAWPFQERPSLGTGAHCTVLPPFCRRRAFPACFGGLGQWCCVTPPPWPSIFWLTLASAGR